MTIDFQHIAYALIGVIFAWVIYDVKEQKTITKDHERRIQKVEDLHGRDIEEIKRMLFELSSEVKALSKNMNKENSDLLNLVSQQKSLIDLVKTHIESLVTK